MLVLRHHQANELELRPAYLIDILTFLIVYSHLFYFLKKYIYLV